LTPPGRIPGLVAPDLADREEQERPEEDGEVHEEQQRQLDENERQLRQVLGREELAQARERMQEGRVDPAQGEERLADAEQGQDGGHVERQPPELAAPEPEAPPGDDVLLLEARVGAVQARRRDQLARDHLHEAAEHDHGHRGDDQRWDQPEVVGVEQNQEERGRRQQRHERRRPCEPSPLGRQCRSVLVDGSRHPRTLLCVRHRAADEGADLRESGGS
jgi:hypothetical protein